MVLSNLFLRQGCIWHSELALSDLGGAAKHLLSGLVQDEQFRVVLTGEGADEIAAGYATVRITKVTNNTLMVVDLDTRSSYQTI